jgi:opacity protein-like surface antigen
MKKTLITLWLSFLTFPYLVHAEPVAEAATATSKPYKGESAPQPKAEASSAIDIYKDNPEEAITPPEAKYSGQVYTSDFYQGALQQSDYSVYSDHSLHDGFYLGLEAGYDFYKIRNSIDDGAWQRNPDLSTVGMSYAALGGFGKYFDAPLYMGIEIFYNYSRAASDNNVGGNGGDSDIDYRVKSVILGTYGASFMPGIKLSDSTLFYLKGGYTRIDMKTYETSDTLSLNNAQSNGVNGVHFGLGLEANIYRNLSVRGEYTHTNAQNFKTLTGTVVTPTNNQVMLGLIVHLA